MTRDEKVAEFKLYTVCSDLLHVDIDKAMIDQAAEDAPDSALDEALPKIASLVGGMLGRGSVTAPELADNLDKHRRVAHEWFKSRAVGVAKGQKPPFSLRLKR